MTIDAYTNTGLNRLPPYLIEAARDPVNGVDIVSPNGDFYNRQYEWFNTVDRTFWFYTGQGIWIKMTGASGPMLQFTGGSGTTGFPVNPDGTGHVELTSNAGTIAITGSTNSINFDLAGGGLAVDQINVDAHTAPGTDPVLPSGSGQITLEGGATFATATQNNPIRTNSLAANTIDLQIQLAGNNATTAAANKFGVAQFEASQFNVSNGFVQLVGGTAPASQKFNVDDSTAPGTDPVIPDGSGQVIVQGGSTYAAGTRNNPIRTNSLAANTIDLEIQLAGKNATTANAAKFGVAQFDSNTFEVASGFVTLPNALNSFTPELNFGGLTTGITYSSQIGNYWKIGSLVLFNISFTLTNKGAAVGAATITGLPVTPANGCQVYCGFGTVTLDAGYAIAVGVINSGSGTISLAQNGSGLGAISLTDANFANTSRMNLFSFFSV